MIKSFPKYSHLKACSQAFLIPKSVQKALRREKELFAKLRECRPDLKEEFVQNCLRTYGVSLEYCIQLAMEGSPMPWENF